MADVITAVSITKSKLLTGKAPVAMATVKQPGFVWMLGSLRRYPRPNRALDLFLSETKDLTDFNLAKQYYNEYALLVTLKGELITWADGLKLLCY